MADLTAKELLGIEIAQAERALAAENVAISSPNYWHDRLTGYRESARGGPGGSKVRQTQLLGRLKELRELYESTGDEQEIGGVPYPHPLQ
jgi:hypothetical protein